jgi:hypothetical protein
MRTIILIIFATLLLAACDDRDIQPTTSADYFPLNSGQEWHYQRWVDNLPADASKNIWDTLKLAVAGDTVVEGKTYKIIADEAGNIDKIVRKEGAQYLGRHHELYGDFSHEYVFLDLNKSVGESWSYLKDGGTTKTEYTILSKNANHTVSGVEYNNVIEVKVDYYNITITGDFELWVTAVHHYADGVGEIYHYYPYPVSLVFGNISGYIVKQ